MAPGHHEMLFMARPPTGSSHMVALYIIIPLLVLLLVLLVCYLCCSRHYRLNWYERHLLEAGTPDVEKERFVHRYSIQSLPERRRSSVKYVPLVPEPTLTCSPTSPTSSSDAFWVPPEVVQKKRAQSLCPHLLYTHDEDSFEGRSIFIHN